MRRTRSEVVGRAVRTAIRNPGRSILTMLGLAIGVGAFIAMVSFGTGARTSVMQQFEMLGTRVVYVWGNMGQRNFSGSSKTVPGYVGTSNSASRPTVASPMSASPMGAATYMWSTGAPMRNKRF